MAVLLPVIERLRRHPHAGTHTHLHMREATPLDQQGYEPLLFQRQILTVLQLEMRPGCGTHILCIALCEL
jgi:hypothetical protein